MLAGVADQDKPVFVYKFSAAGSAEEKTIVMQAEGGAARFDSLRRRVRCGQVLGTRPGNLVRAEAGNSRCRADNPGSSQIQPLHDDIQVDGLPAIAEAVTSVQVHMPLRCRRH